MSEITKRKSFRRFGSVSLLCILIHLTGCSEDGFVVDRKYDFLVNIGSAEITTQGKKIDPLSLLLPAPPWTEDERLFYPAPPRTTIRFRNVPLGKKAALKVGMGLLRTSAEPEHFDKNSKITFRIDLETEGRRFSLLDRDVATSALTRGVFDEERIELPEHGAVRGDFVFYSHKSPGLESLQSAWRSPLLISEGRPVNANEASVSCQQRIALLLDHLSDEAEADRSSFRADFDENKKEFLPDPQGRLLMQNVPSSKSFDLAVPPGCSLVFGIASIGRTGKTSHEILFEVRDGEKVLFSESLPATGQASSRKISVPLRFRNGESTSLSLTTSFSQGNRKKDDTVAIWINPEITRTDQVRRQHFSSGKSIILMVVDALRADHISGYGYDRTITPNLDRFIKKSVVFENAWSQSSWTVPATATLLTGQYSYTHGLYDVNHWFLVPGIATITENFQRSGMTTAAFVANHLISADNNFTVGFENFHSIPWCTAAQLNNAFLNWLDNHSDERFFAYLHYMEPHMPYAAPGERLNRFGSTPAESSNQDRSGALMFHLVKSLKELAGPADRSRDFDDQLEAEIEELIDLYDSEIAYWDQRFGLLVDDLAARGILEDTIIIVTSDHGEEFMDHGQVQHGQSLHRELLHEPLIFGNTPFGASRRMDMAGLIDVAPTLLALAGDGNPKGGGERENLHAGIDLFGEAPEGRVLFAETAHGLHHLGAAMSVQQAVFTNDLKGILTCDDGHLALYDRRQDRYEEKDLAEERPETAARLKKLISQWIDECRSTAPFNISLFDASAMKQLEAIGYLK